MEQKFHTVLHLRSTGGFLGAESVILEIAKHSPKFGYTSIIAALQDRKDPEPELTTRATAVGIQTCNLKSEAFFDFQLARNISDLIQKHNVNIVHTHGYKEDFYALLARTGRPKVATNHLWKKTNPRLRFYAFADSWCLRAFDRVVAVSKPILEETWRAGVPKQKLSLVRNGVDTALFDVSPVDVRRSIRNALDIPVDATVFGQISSLTSEKGHRFAISAWAEVISRFPESRLLIVGEGPEYEMLSLQARELRIENTVIFAGRRSDVPQVLAAIDVFLLPSLIEGMPMALLEAMAAKKAVIASTVGDILEAITDRQNGLVVAPGDTQGLSSAMLSLLAVPSEINRLGNQARATVVSQFSSESMTQKYCEIYDALLNPL